MAHKATANTYDFIIAGMGCAGLSLAVQLQKSSVKFDKVLLIDQEQKNKNDRTWCFWTKEKNNWYDDCIFKRWDNFTFESSGFKKEFLLEPYQYCMIKGQDFYTYCLNILCHDTRFEIVTEQITEIQSTKEQAVLKTSTQQFSAPYLFNSAFRTIDKKTNHINYVQHFMGWVVETPTETFNEGCPVFMNFNTAQYGDCRFFYLLPYSKTKALIEYTGFSERSLKVEDYLFELKKHLHQDLNINTYTILEQEKGEIPMAESAFVNPYGKRVINIGTAGGSSKPSTGYTFYFIQKNTKEIISQLEADVKSLTLYKRKSRFLLYDKILLEVLDKKKIPARNVFKILFQKNDISSLLAFLNEESTLREDLSILNSVPKKEFIAAALRKIISIV